MLPAIYGILTGNIDTSAWNFPSNFVLPIDKKSVFGWFFNWFFQFNVVFNYAVCINLIATHFAWCCYYIIASCDHFDLIINSLRIDCEQIWKEKNTQKRLRMWSVAAAKLRKAIKLHANIHE